MLRLAFFACLIAFRPGLASAAVVSLSFSGTYEAGPEPIFGQPDSYLPFEYIIAYDPTLNEEPAHVSAGVDLGGYLTTHEWFGYSASGIVATSLHFGDMTWTVADLQPMIPAAGVIADLWFDVDLRIATPSRAWAYFESYDTDGRPRSLMIGGGASDDTIFLTRETSQVSDSPNTVYSTDMRIAVVPESGPAMLACVASILATMSFRRWRSQPRQRRRSM